MHFRKFFEVSSLEDGLVAFSKTKDGAQAVAAMDQFPDWGDKVVATATEIINRLHNPSESALLKAWHDAYWHHKMELFQLMQKGNKIKTNTGKEENQKGGIDFKDYQANKNNYQWKNAGLAMQERFAWMPTKFKGGGYWSAPPGYVFS